jgi:tetraacyldisaccharide 4'-kinase
MFKLLGAPWGAIAAMRAATYQRGWRQIAELPRPTLSVGGLSVGGVGKTPSVAAIAELLIATGLSPAILSRGYRRQGRHPLLVSRGHGQLLVDPRRAGDEPFLLARTLPRAIVAVAARREQAAELALSAGEVDAFLLDDAYQHLRVARDVNFLVVDSSLPFWQDTPLPAGGLRESPAAASRADAFLLVVGSGADIMPSLRARHPDVPVFKLETAAPAAWSLTDYAGCVTADGHVTTAVQSPSPMAPVDLPQPLFAFAGIARPNRFFEDLEEMGLALAGRRSFPDHHVYKPTELRRLEQQARDAGANALITTEKDAVRLSAHEKRVEIYVWRYRLRPRRPEVLGKWLMGRIRSAGEKRQ